MDDTTNLRRAWLSNLKVGDGVVERASGSIGSHDSLSTVERFTKTMIVTSRGKRYRKLDGHSPGGGYYGSRLDEPTEELIDKIRRYNLASRLDNLRFEEWRAMSQETLRAMVALLPQKSS